MEDGADGSFKQVRKMRNALTHERFSADTDRMDFAPIELETPVEFNECISVIRTGCGVVSYPMTSVRVMVMQTMVFLLSRLTECFL